MSRPSNDKLVEWIEAINRGAVNLTAWEIDFMESMLTKVEMYGDRARFTDAQAEQIERIFTERVP